MVTMTRPEHAPATRRAPLVVLRTIPATITMLGFFLVCALATQALWQPFDQHPLWQTLAYGLPALEQGRWWTPVSGAFLLNAPLAYIPSVIAFWGMAYLEYRRGSVVALAYFWVGQLFAVLATALLLWALALTGWTWAVQEAAALDAGPSGGTMACIAAAIGLFVSPWRARAWFVLLGFVFIAVVFWGAVADIEHVLSVLLVLAVDRSLRVRGSTVREQRLIAFSAVILLGLLELIVLLVPTDGPFGPTAPATGSIWDVALDVVIIGAVATGVRRGRRWAWVVSVILAILNVLTGVLILVDILIDGWSGTESLLGGDPSLSLATSTMWLLLLVYLIRVRRAFRARRRATLGAHPLPTAAEVRDAIRHSGGGTLSWMTTWEPNTYARCESGIVAYQRRAGVALALADPIGPPQHRPDAVRDFIEAAEHAGLVPAFFGASDETRRAVPRGWRSLVVADDSIVDLAGLAFTGKRWNSVRTSLNRAGREQMTFRMTRLKDESWGVQAQVRAISEMWVGDRDLPEMGFTLGSLTEAEDPEVRVALALSAGGDVDGFLSWLPVYGEGSVRGWTLDLMRRREGGFGPVMEYLIGMSAVHFRDEGAQFMSLSGAPLAHDYPPDAGVLAGLSDRLAGALEPVYGFRSLHRFKEKFHPRYETLYLLFRDESDLTRVAAALTRAFLPNATLRQFAGAGRELVRGGD